MSYVQIQLRINTYLLSVTHSMPATKSPSHVVIVNIAVGPCAAIAVTIQSAWFPTGWQSGFKLNVLNTKTIDSFKNKFWSVLIDFDILAENSKYATI